MSEYLLELIDIRKSFGNNQVIKGINLKVKAGEIHGLIGKNGAGKTTLMKILNGVIPKESGSILLRGKPIDINSIKQARINGISMVYQELSLFPNLTVAENIFVGRFPKNGLFKFGIIDPQYIYQEAQRILDRLHFPIDISLKVGRLGLGQQYMVEIARILSQHADILILDEPTVALNEQEVSYFLKVLREVQSLGVTVIYISHRLKEMKEIAQSITVIRDGMDVASFPINTVESEEIFKLMVGEEALGRYPKLGLPTKKEILRIESLSLGNFLKDISFTLHEGEILGIAGLAGSGRTALMETIFGVTSQTQGRTFLRGREIKIKSPKQAIKLGIAYLAEDRARAGLFNHLPVKSNIVASNLKRVSQKGVINLFKEHQLATGLSRRLGMQLYNVQQMVSTLSGGNQQKTLLAKWLFSGGYVYLLDEPTRGLDIAAKVDIYNILNSLICGGSGIVMISSDLSELIGMCHRVLVMFKGRIVGELRGADISEERILQLSSGRD